MLKKQKRLSTFFLYLKLLKKWGYKQKKNFIIANIFMFIVALATSTYPLIIDFAFDVISEKNKQYIFLLPVLIPNLSFLNKINDNEMNNLSTQLISSGILTRGGISLLVAGILGIFSKKSLKITDK